MVPASPGGRVFLVLYSFIGIGIFGGVVAELGDLLLTASEAPAYWLCRALLLRAHPNFFPGVDVPTWEAHGAKTALVSQVVDRLSQHSHGRHHSPGGGGGGHGSGGRAVVDRRRLWVGNVPAVLATEANLTEIFTALGEVEKVTVPPEAAQEDPTSRWALVTLAEGCGDAPAAAAKLRGDPALGVDGVLCVLSAQPAEVGLHMLQTGAVSLGKLQAGMAVCLWLVILFGLGPAYGTYTHHWTWEESFYFTYITMTTIGYGDFFPMNDSAEYTDSADSTHHQVFVWAIGEKRKRLCFTLSHV